MGVSSVLGSSALLPAGLGFRNVLINGSMGVAQRTTSAGGITGAGYHTVDRWTFNPDSAGTWTMTQENDGPSGFRKSAKVLCTVANTLAAGDNLTFLQRIEGVNAQGFNKGSATPRPFALSFWVKSNVTGTYIVELYDIDNTRQVSASYTISLSNTWEYKTIIFPIDVSGLLDYDNNNSLQCTFWLTAGSTFSSGTLNTSWASVTNANRAVGQVHLAAAVNNYWQVTGVQLEANHQPTPFEQRPFGVELQLCQRYYEQSYDYGVTPGTVTMTGAFSQGGSGDASGNHFKTIRFAVPKRYNGYTMTGYRTSDGLANIWVVFSSPQPTNGWATTSSFDLRTIYGTRVYSSDGGYAWINGIHVGHWVCNAEL